MVGVGWALAMALAAAAAAPRVPRECKARSDAPYLPTFHIIGNVTEGANPRSFQTEAINDVSSIVKYMGVYHLFHQCCQNHWDHVVSDDLVHWRRLPSPVRPSSNPKEWYDARGSYDGSLVVLPPDQGGPVILYDAIQGTPPPAGGPGGLHRNGDGDHNGWMAISRPVNLSDPYLTEWAKAPNNPIVFDEAGQPADGPQYPSAIWYNPVFHHWNFLSLGYRWFTVDPSFHTWTRANSSSNPQGLFAVEGSRGTGQAGRGEQGGQWFFPLPNTTDGKAPPAGSPTHAINFYLGNQFALGDYSPANESWRFRKFDHRIDSGPTDGWSCAQYAGDRLFNMGWAPRGRTPGGAGRANNQNDQLTLLREVRYEPRLETLVANPVPELVRLRNGTVASESHVQLPAGTVHTLAGTGGGAAAAADLNVTFELPADGSGVGLFGVVVLAGTPYSGVEILVNVSAAGADGRRQAVMTSGRRNGSCFYPGCCTGAGHHCTERTLDNCDGKQVPCDGPKATDKTMCRFGNPGGDCGGDEFVVLPGETSVNFRVLVDRAIVEAFVMGGRAVTTQTFRPYDQGVPDTRVGLIAGDAPMAVREATVWSMGCGWEADA